MLVPVPLLFILGSHLHLLASAAGNGDLCPTSEAIIPSNALYPDFSDILFRQGFPRNPDGQDLSFGIPSTQACFLEKFSTIPETVLKASAGLTPFR
jgi:hypothetical protein